MSKKCRAYSASKLGLEPADNRKAFYAGWDAAIEAAEKQEPVAWVEQDAIDWLERDERKHAYTNAALYKQKDKWAPVPLYATPPAAPLPLLKPIGFYDKENRDLRTEIPLGDDPKFWEPVFVIDGVEK
jgi:hypothetical protein